eukprot:TRINITY_DN2829_c0_g1_i1.p1 TRINITY_DN2829_c0_g1~~TRINITY_DN2829_c0_g1_i1.p1  ORF type:complete len:601 (-),score=65.62 TRINITY_DN2829_c0_g1_i1:1673-3475(-)
MQTVVLLYLFLLGVVLLGLYGSRIGTKIRLRSVPGPQTSWLFGNLLQVKHLVDNITDWSKIHGSVFKIFFGGRSMIVVSDPELARTVFMKSHHRPLNAFTPPSAGWRRYMQEQSLVWSHGQMFKTLKSAWQVAFNQGSVHNYFPLMQHHANRFCDIMQLKAKSAEFFDVHQEIQKMTLEVVGTTAFGIDFGLIADNNYKQNKNDANNTNTNNSSQTDDLKFQYDIDNNHVSSSISNGDSKDNLNNQNGDINNDKFQELKEFRENVVENIPEKDIKYDIQDYGIDPSRLLHNVKTIFGAILLSGKSQQSIWVIFNYLFPELRKIWAILNQYVPTGKFEKNIQKALRETFQDSIQIAQLLRTSLSKKNDKVIDPGSFLAKMVDTKDPFSKGEMLDDSQVGCQAYIFMLGGFETTANSLAFTLYLLSRTPLKKQKLLQEIDQFDQDADITLEILEKCSYLEAVVKESLRLFPPGAITVRSVYPALKFSTYDFPQNSDFMINIYGIQRDNKIWQNANEFVPERFLKNSELYEMDKIHPFAYLPFGGGSRMCIGHRYAMQELKLGIFKIYQRYDFVLEAGQENLKTKVAITMSPEKGLFVKAIKR